MRLYELLESLDKNQKRAGQVAGEERAKEISPVLGKEPKQHPLKGRLVGEGTEDQLNIGDPVIITGNVNFKGKTGDIVSFGKDNKFVVVDLYNYGRHSFHSSDVSYNDYADEDDDLNEVAPSGREKQVKALKKVPGITNPYAVAWASYNKSHKRKK